MRCKPDINNRGIGDKEEALLEAIPTNFATLDREGVVLDVNPACRACAKRNGCGLKVGVNFLAICEASEEKNAHLRRFATQIRSVLAGKSRCLSLDCPFSGHLYSGYVTAWGRNGSRRAMLFQHETAKRAPDHELQPCGGDFMARQQCFRDMAGDGKEVFWLWEANLEKIQYVSPAFEEIWGKTCQELYQDTRVWLDSVHPEDRDMVLKTIDRHSGSKEQWHLEYRVIRPDGMIRWVWGQRSPLLNSAGRLNGIAGIVLDITESKCPEQALRESEADLAHSQQLAHVGSWKWDLIKGTVKWSEELFRIFGVDSASFVPSNAAVQAMVHPKDRTLHAELIGKALQGETVKPFECRLVRPNGEERFVLASGFDVKRDALGKPVQLFGSVFDITERKRVEHELKRANCSLLLLKKRAEASQIDASLGFQSSSREEIGGDCLVPLPKQGGIFKQPTDFHKSDFLALRAKGLTRRECEVLYWIIQGKRDGEIAAILSNSLRTINHHVSNILQKLDVETRTMAATRALDLLVLNTW